MAHAQKSDFVFRRNGRVHLNQRGRQFSRLLAAEVCASAVVMLDTPCSEVVWRVLATHSIRQFPLHFPSRASPCAITVQLESTLTMLKFGAVAPVVQCCSTQLVVHKNKAYWRYTCTPTRGLQLHVAAVVRAVSKHEKQHYLVFEIYWHLGGGWNYVSSNKVTIVALIKTQNTASAYPTATPPPQMPFAIVWWKWPNVSG